MRPLADRRPGGVGRLAGAEQIYVMPVGWDEAPWWSEAQIDNLRAILDSVKRTYNVDENRVVLSRRIRRRDRLFLRRDARRHAVRGVPSAERIDARAEPRGVRRRRHPVPAQPAECGVLHREWRTGSPLPCRLSGAHPRPSCRWGRAHHLPSAAGGRTRHDVVARGQRRLRDLRSRTPARAAARSADMGNFRRACEGPRALAGDRRARRPGRAGADARRQSLPSRRRSTIPECGSAARRWSGS